MILKYIREFVHYVHCVAQETEIITGNSAFALFWRRERSLLDPAVFPFFGTDSAQGHLIIMLTRP